MGVVMLALALLLTVTAILFWFLVRTERRPPSKDATLRRPASRIQESQDLADEKERAQSSHGHR